MQDEGDNFSFFFFFFTDAENFWYVDMEHDEMMVVKIKFTTA